MNDQKNVDIYGSEPISPDAARAARDTLGGPLAVAGPPSQQLGMELIAAARESFSQGLRVTAEVSAAVAIGLAIIVAVLLRDRPVVPHETAATKLQITMEG